MSRRLVALSIGDTPSLAAHGFGLEHLAEALVRIARLIIRRGADVAFGGDLRRGGFTELLVEVIGAESRDVQVVDDGDERSAEFRRLINYIGWPHYRELTADLQARTLSVCRYVRIPPPGEGVDAVDNDATSVDYKLRRAMTLSRMRRAMTEGCEVDLNNKQTAAASARVVLGGKVFGYSGLMPGIPEEAAWAARVSGKMPLVVLGGFGGAASVLADGIRDGKVPVSLTAAGQLQDRRNGNLAALHTEFAARLRSNKSLAQFNPKDRYAELAKLCRDGIAGLSQRNGLSDAENRDLLHSTNSTTVLRLLGKVIDGVGTAPPNSRRR